jgi:ferredoxin-thioredoxin reductase catalytic subunit
MVRLEKGSDIAYYGERAFANRRGYPHLAQREMRAAVAVSILSAEEDVGLAHCSVQRIAEGR